MRVVLKAPYQTTPFIESLNEQLFQFFGANHSTHFIHEKFLQEEADYLNTDPEGLRQLPHFQRPIAISTLHNNFFWYRIGVFHFKISGEPTTDEARDAIAVCKWIIKTKRAYIDTETSQNFSRKIVAEYLSPLFEDDGYNLTALWAV